MPTQTYDLIASSILGAGAANVTFSSITSSYRDLVLVIKLANGVDGRFTQLRFNGDTGSNYRRVYMQTNGSSSLASNETQTYFRCNQTGQDDSLFLTSIFDYSTTNKHKSMMNRYGQASGSFPGTGLALGRWANTAAITSIEVSLNADNLPAGSKIFLYGLVS